MAKDKFLDLDGLQIFKDKIMEQITIKTDNQFKLVVNEEDGSLSLVYDETTT